MIDGAAPVQHPGSVRRRGESDRGGFAGVAPPKQDDWAFLKEHPFPISP